MANFERKVPAENQAKSITAGEVIAAYKPFIDQGIAAPDLLGDSEAVNQANELFDVWQKQLDEQAKGDKFAEVRADLAKSMFYVNAGFTDKMYLEEVKDEWLLEVMQYAEMLEDGPEKDKIMEEIREAEEKIERILAEQE